MYTLKRYLQALQWAYIQQQRKNSSSVPSFSPSDISGLVLWLRDDQGVFQDTVGGLVSTNGDPVGAWEDQSGQGNHVTQTGVARPTLTAGGLDFNGGQWLDGPLSSSQPATIIARVEFDALSTGAFQAVWDAQQASNRWFLSADSNTDELLIFAGSLVNSSTVSASESTLTTVINGASSILYRDGSIIGAGNTGSNILSNFRIGNNRALTGALTGQIKHILAYNKVLTAQERADVEQWISDNS